MRTNVIFNLPLECRTYISKKHPGFALEADVDTAVKISAQLQAMINGGGLRRPLCDDKELVLRLEKQYQRYVGRHQEQLSLFALPQNSPDSDEASDLDDGSESDDHQLPPSDEISEQMTDGEERNSKPRHQSVQFPVLPQRFKPETGWDPGWDDNDGTGNTHKAPMSMEAMLDEERRAVLALLEGKDLPLASRTIPQEPSLEAQGTERDESPFDLRPRPLGRHPDHPGRAARGK